MRLKEIFAATLLVISTGAHAADTHVWWEAEDAESTNFPDITSTNARGAEILSNGKWIGGDTGSWPEGDRFLEYRVEVPADGTYDLFVRKFWKHGPFKWRFNDDEWQELTNRRTTLLDNVDIMTHWGANWVPLGQVELRQGPAKFRVELNPDDKGVAYFDAFLLTTEPFLPNGKEKPGTALAPAPEGWFNFRPSSDKFTDESLVDMRYLNEKTAGDGGFVVSRDGDFVQEKSGKPIKFLGANVGANSAAMQRGEVDRLAKFIAKKGVNLIRYHGPVCKASGKDAFEIDEEVLDDLFYLQAALKKQGVYLLLSIYFPLWMKLHEAPGFEAYDTDKFRGKPPFAVHFYDPEFQEHMRNWWTQLLTRVNPYTGLRLADDPSVMGAELLNEDSFFFWTFNNDHAPKEKKAILERMFKDWALKRYGSMEGIKKAWANEELGEDAEADGGLALMNAWHFTQNKNFSKKFSQRTIDTVDFLAEVQTDFFKQMRDHLRQLGFKASICSSNWKTADPRVLDPVEKLTNLETDFMDYHGYFSAPLNRKQGSFLPVPGDTFRDRSLIRRDPANGPLENKVFDPSFLDMVYNGQPSMVSEFTMMHQNRFRGELPVAAAAMFAQAGIDAPIYFAIEEGASWRNDELSHWPVKTPAEIGQFPAMALIFRESMVDETKPVVKVSIPKKHALGLKGTPIVTANMQDANRMDEGQSTYDAIDPSGRKLIDFKAFAAGKVTMDFTDDDDIQVEIADMAKYDDSKAGRLSGLGGQTVWDYTKNVYEIQTPEAQAAVGFLGEAGEINLEQISVELENENAAVALVSMDGRPIQESDKLLLSVFASQRNTGFETKDLPDGSKEFVSTGHAPLQIEKIVGAVKLHRKDAAKLKAQPCDYDGYPVGPPIEGVENLKLLPDVLNYVIHP